MKNSTQVLYFTLAAFTDVKLLKYFLFLVILCFYLLIMCSNLLLISVICMNRSLHEPMYVLLCSLFVNELYGSTALFPFLLLQILSDVHTVSASFCFLQIFCLYTYVCIEFYNLAIMSYDRYVAICLPLQYHTRMTARKISVLVCVSWVHPAVVCLIPICLSASLQLCGSVINKIYCDNYAIVQLSCSDTTINNIYGLVATFVVVSFPVSLICYTYVSILQVCFSGSRQTRQKAVSTCTPHLASLLNLSCGCFFEIFQSRFDMTHVPNTFRVFLSLYWLVCQPLFNPVMYGLKVSHIRKFLKKSLR
ncbi:olfactory receptor 10J5 [Takifugu rubripes]|uniref:Olfactory receptor n=1 Tax=Takifugu rubripes TaxID=31033 RepID=A0A674NVJ7_TAKRU|nr:olfactory receptor 10J5 [Takifugu rubripes]